MTRDERITISMRELEKLPADELAIIARHFQTEDRAELARQLADEAEEMWSGDHEAPVPEAEWPSAHLQLLLDMHRDEKREALLAEQHRIASEVIDGLSSAYRVLLCWRFHTTVQRRVVALLAAATVRATEEGLVKTASFKEAARTVADFEVGLQIDEIEDHYYHGGDARRLDVGREGN
ncbi:MAG: hypothetical protein JNL82_16115 [Myxococcales bacterium]|nr:hypothetical protein [Myxococcales bacterium]